MGSEMCIRDSNSTISGNTKISKTTESTSTSTGALIVSGGAGIAANLYVGGNSTISGNVNISKNTESTSTSSGTLIVTGGAGISANLYVGGNVNISKTTESTSTSTGALIVSGGAGIAANLYVGGNSTISGNVKISKTTESSSTSTGALIVSGGAGIGKKLYVGGDLYLNNNYSLRLSDSYSNTDDLSFAKIYKDSSNYLNFYNNQSMYFYTPSGTGMFFYVNNTQKCLVRDSGLDVSGIINVYGSMVINEPTGTVANATAGSLIIKHNNLQGTSSIMFPSNASNTDYGYIQYNDSNIVQLPTTVVTSPSNLQLWLDANDYSTMILSGSSVQQWGDKSAYSNNATVHVGNATYVSTGFNGLPAIQINSGGLIAASPATALLNSVTIFVVFQKNNANNEFEGLISKGNYGPSPFEMWDDKRFYLNNASTSKTLVPIGDVTNIKTATGLNMLSITISSSSWTEYLNGSPKFVGTITDGPLTNPLSLSSIFIGTRGNKTTLFTGVIAEVIVYNNVLTTTERQNIEQYLTTKWLTPPIYRKLTIGTKNDAILFTPGSGVGYVGINKTDPAYTLDVSGSCNISKDLTCGGSCNISKDLTCGGNISLPNNYAIYLTTTTGVNPSKIYNNTYLYFETDDIMYFRCGGAGISTLKDILVLTNAANTGLTYCNVYGIFQVVGKPTYLANCHVYGTLDVSGGDIFINNITSTTYGFAMSTGSSYSDDDTNKLRLFNNKSTTYIDFASSSDNKLHWRHGTPVTEYLTFDGSNQRVGVGITSPTCALDVSGSCKVSGTLTCNGDTLINTNKLYFTTTSKIYNNTYLYFETDDIMYFRCGGAGSSTLKDILVLQTAADTNIPYCNVNGIFHVLNSATYLDGSCDIGGSLTCNTNIILPRSKVLYFDTDGTTVIYKDINNQYIFSNSEGNFYFDANNTAARMIYRFKVGTTIHTETCYIDGSGITLPSSISIYFSSDRTNPNDYAGSKQTQIVKNADDLYFINSNGNMYFETRSFSNIFSFKVRRYYNAIDNYEYETFKVHNYGVQVTGSMVINEEGLGTPAAVDKGSLILKSVDASGCSSIVFPGNSDYAFIQYNKTNGTASDTETSCLTIGTNDNSDDSIVLLPGARIGCVGINKFSPTYTLDISGTCRVSGSFSNNSDYRLKTNITNLNEYYNIDKLRPVKYNLNGEISNNIYKLNTGFIAHEVQEHFPHLVTGEKDGKDMQSLNYDGLISILTYNIQQLKSQITQQQSQIDYLMNFITTKFNSTTDNTVIP